MKIRLVSSLAAIGVCLAFQQTRAADIYLPMTPNIQEASTPEGWTFTFAPYFWAAGISGDIAQFGLPQVTVDASFDNIFDHLDVGLMAIGEARYGPYSVIGDAIYIKLSGQTGSPVGNTAASVKLETSTFAGLLGAGYTFAEDEKYRLEVVGGLRVWSVDSTLSITGGAFDGRSRSDSATWVDAMAGLRGSYFLTPKVYLTGWGFIGAGGADLDWDVAATIGYRFNDTVSVVAGYRALGVDYNSDGFVFNVVEQGPIIGLSLRF
ncbi:hypothetical protein [Martelella sp. AD-3]|uniref:hypothetical protein n=1 Tax=Martelella sp. AD-3 TaxID=686597 RepID=UPI000466610E|nr:hypothetical protein [Martelella sp. AD-3]AMM86740.1 hypothetical protein AZF01_09310 [Martelella sp. AD-3]